MLNSGPGNGVRGFITLARGWTFKSDMATKNFICRSSCFGMSLILTNCQFFGEGVGLALSPQIGFKTNFCPQTHLFLNQT